MDTNLRFHRISELSRLDEEYKTLQERLESLTHKRARFAPIYSLPDDVLFRILELTYTHEFPHGCQPESPSPIVITHVSRRWRQVALACPVIWSCVHVMPNCSANHFQLVELHLKRSGKRPLSITFVARQRGYFRYHTPPMPQSWAKFANHTWVKYLRCLDLLISEKHRWKECSFFFLHRQSMEYLLEHLSKEDAVVPLLNNLRLYVWEETDMLTLPLYPQTLRLESLDTTSVIPILASPFDNLTDLTLRHLSIPSIRDWFEAIECVPSLRTLVLSAIGFDEASIEDTTAQPMELPHLRNLVLDNVHPLALLLRWFRAPALERLEICDVVQEWTFVDDLTGGGNVSHPNVRHLSLVKIDSHHVPATMFNIFPILQSLDLSHSDPSHFLRALAYGPGDLICPNLEVLTITELNSEDDGAVLLSLARYRKEIVSRPLKMLRAALVRDEREEDFFPPELRKDLSQYVDLVFVSARKNHFESWDYWTDKPHYRSW